MHDLLTLMTSRVSTPKLGLPAPTREQVLAALACAQRAPDHGRLKPWRFHVLEGADLQSLGELYVAAATAQNPALDAGQSERLRGMPLRAPMVIVVSCKVVLEHKVPVWEQVVSVGCATQNLQLALHALGFGCMWRTGELASDLTVKARFGLSEADQIVSFLYVGTPLEAAKASVNEGVGTVFFGMP